jgi:TolA-binding protein
LTENKTTVERSMDRKERNMNTTRIVGILTGAWIALALALGTPFSLAGEAKESATAPSGQQQKEDYQKKMETKLKELNQELKEWKDKAQKMEKNARAEMDEQIAKLNKKEEEASKKLQDLKSKTGRAWEDFKGGVDSAVEDLSKAFDQMRSRFKSS